MRSRNGAVRRFLASVAVVTAATLAVAAPASAKTYLGIDDVTGSTFAAVPGVSGTCTSLDGTEVLSVTSLSLAVYRSYSYFKVNTAGQLALQTTIIGTCGNKSSGFEDQAPQVTAPVWGTNQLTVNPTVPTNMVWNFDGGDPGSSYSWNVHLTAGAGQQHSIVYVATTPAQKKAFASDLKAYNNATTVAGKAAAANQAEFDLAG
jgi:hypothetical protein